MRMVAVSYATRRVKGSKQDGNARSCESRNNNRPVSGLPVRTRTYELMLKAGVR
jgi:hypothetical protein